MSAYCLDTHDENGVTREGVSHELGRDEVAREDVVQEEGETEASPDGC